MKMKMVYSAYGKKPAFKINYDLIATILSILSYSLIVLEFYHVGYFFGILASMVLASLFRKNSYLLGLYGFFLIANLIGFFK